MQIQSQLGTSIECHPTKAGPECCAYYSDGSTSCGSSAGLYYAENVGPVHTASPRSVVRARALHGASSSGLVIPIVAILALGAGVWFARRRKRR